MRVLCYIACLFIVAAGFTSCSKNFTLKNDGNHTVRIRVENKTSLAVTAMKVNGEDYGTVAAGESSSYHTFSNLTHVPSVTFNNDSTQVLITILYCGNDFFETAYLENGDYVYTISTNSANYYGCDYSFVKE